MSLKELLHGLCVLDGSNVHQSVTFLPILQLLEGQGDITVVRNEVLGLDISMGRDSEVGLERSIIESDSEEEYTSSTLRMPEEHFRQ